MSNNIKYIKEIYVDDYNTFSQVILIDYKVNNITNGLHAKLLRSSVNPNLHLSKTIYIRDEEEEKINE